MKKAILVMLAVVLGLLLCACAANAPAMQATCTHNWKAATCSAPKTCTKCNQTEGVTLSHTWKAATCTAPKTCTKCNKTEGVALAHTWKEATCTKPKTCTKCNTTEGSATAHSYNTNGKCTMCYTVNPNISEIKNRIKIYGTWIEMDSANGVSLYITWENTNTKEIKYITFIVELYNRVNDPIACTIRNNSTQYVKQTGPIPKGKGCYQAYFRDVILKGVQVSIEEENYDLENGWSGIYWDNVWYNSSAHYAKVVGVNIEYMDGTTYSCFDKNAFACLGSKNLTILDEIEDYV